MNVRALGPVLLLAAAACGDDAAQGDVGATTDVAGDVLFPDVGDPSTDAAAPDTSAPDTTAPPTDSGPGTTDTATTDTATTDTATTDTATIDSGTAGTDTGTSLDDATTSPGDAVTDTADAADTAGPKCFTLPPGHTRHLVVARPTAEPDGAEVDRWEVLPLLGDGTLGAPVDTFTMARAGYGKASFSADGALGVVAADDGKLAVFALDGEGQAHVIDPGSTLDIYPSAAYVDGDRVLLVDGNWQANGGGIYAARLGCDGSVGTPALLYPTKLAVGLHQRADGAHIVAAKEAVDTLTGAVHVVTSDSADHWTRRATAAPFDDVAILSSLAVTGDGRFALVGDNQFFDETPNRVGVVGVSAAGATVVDVLTPIEDPFDMVVSPFDDAVLVVTGFADDVRVLDYDATRDPPFVDMGPPDYVTQKPQLPGDAVLVGGAFPDLVFVAENQAIRRFRFEGDGSVTDLGRTAAGVDSYDAIPGALGMQP